MNLDDLLTVKKDEIVAQAAAAVQRAELQHYEQAGQSLTAERLQTLYELMSRCIRERDLGPIVRYAETLAEERHAAGYDLLEVQVAFNALEEALWQQILAEMAPESQGEALGLTSTVHGAGKDALARKYVALAGQPRPPSLNLGALFAGTDGV